MLLQEVFILILDPEWIQGVTPTLQFRSWIVFIWPWPLRPPTAYEGAKVQVGLHLFSKSLPLSGIMSMASINIKDVSLLFLIYAV